MLSRAVSSSGNLATLLFGQAANKYYGSLSLKRLLGPNLLRGFAVSVGLHLIIVALPLLQLLFAPAPEVRKERIRVLDLSQITKVEPPPPEPPKPARGSGSEGGSTPKLATPIAAAPAMLPPGILATPFEFDISGPSLVEQEASQTLPPFLTPSPNLASNHIEAVPYEMPDITPEFISSESNAAGSLPNLETKRGAISLAPSNSDLNISMAPAFSAPNIGTPGSDLPYDGLSRGDTLSTAAGTGFGIGDPNGSPYGTGNGRGGATGTGTGRGNGAGSGVGPGTGSGEGSGNGYASGRGGGGSGTGDGIATPHSSDVVTKNSLSGLLSWLRKNRYTFPPVVQSYLETTTTDLCGVTTYGGWDIFIQFSEAEHQLKILLTRGGTGILLADSDFKERSQFFGQGNVTREGSLITAIAARRDKPSAERTDEFYRLFAGWMGTVGISLGSRAAR